MKCSLFIVGMRLLESCSMSPQAHWHSSHQLLDCAFSFLLDGGSCDSSSLSRPILQEVSSKKFRFVSFNAFHLRWPVNIPKPQGLEEVQGQWLASQPFRTYVHLISRDIMWYDSAPAVCLEIRTSIIPWTFGLFLNFHIQSYWWSSSPNPP